MPVPEFEWKTYNIPVRSTEAFKVATGQAEQTEPIKIPDLTPWPGPLEKAHALLLTAAEVEHALLVQYLYAAFSLNRQLPDGPRHDAVGSWFDTVFGIALQEMGHLMTVQNLLLALGFQPSLEREDFPPRKELYPFALHLEPLSHRSLAKYVAAESPAGAEGIYDILELADVSEGAEVNRVGTIYGLLAFLFSTEDVTETDTGIWKDLMEKIRAAAMAQNDVAAAWHLPESAIVSHSDTDPQSDTSLRQGDPTDWPGVNFVKISSLDTARGAIQRIAAEGEGNAAGDISHFSQFLAIYRGNSTTLPFPPAEEWVPTLPVPTDPHTKDIADIADQRPKLWAQLADLRYGMLLGAIEHYLRTADPAARRKLKEWAISDMRSLPSLAEGLTALHMGAGGVAALPFTMPLLPLPDAEAARWEIHRERRNAAIATIECLLKGPDEGNRTLEIMRGDLEGRDGDGTASIDTSFAKDIRPLFRQIDIDHMNSPNFVAAPFDLNDFEAVKAHAPAIADRIKRTGAGRMPPGNDAPLTPAQTALFDKWVSEGCPP